MYGTRQSVAAFVVTMLVYLTGCVSSPVHEPQVQGPQSDNPPVQYPEPTPVLPESLISEPVVTAASPGVGDEIALRAISLVGKPYRYGGADLQGFDCSGMVYFIHLALGIEVPRTAADQQRAAMSVAKSALQPGDLLFFRTTRATRTSHVGVYVGENRFVHAPQTGKLIELRTLDDQYYGPRLVGTGRLYPGS